MTNDHMLVLTFLTFYAKATTMKFVCSTISAISVFFPNTSAFIPHVQYWMGLLHCDSSCCLEWL